jgi:hypothetical protein
MARAFNWAKDIDTFIYRRYLGCSDIPAFLPSTSQGFCIVQQGHRLNSIFSWTALVYPGWSYSLRYNLHLTSSSLLTAETPPCTRKAPNTMRNWLHGLLALGLSCVTVSALEVLVVSSFAYSFKISPDDLDRTIQTTIDRPAPACTVEKHGVDRSTRIYLSNFSPLKERLIRIPLSAWSFSNGRIMI